MRIIFIITFLAATYSCDTLADLTLQYDRQRAQQTPLPIQVTLKQQRLRISTPSPAQSDLLLDVTTGDIIQLHKQQQSYFSINVKTLNQYVGLYRQNSSLLQGLIAQGLTQVDPAKRSRIENMMNKFKGNAQNPLPVSLKPRPQTRQILGVNCHRVEIWQGKQHLSDVCVASFRDLQFAPDDVKTLQQLKAMLQQFRQQTNDQQDILGMIAKGLENLDGLPLEVVKLNDDGSVHDITRLQRISLRSVADSTMQIPAGFKQKMTPAM